MPSSTDARYAFVVEWYDPTASLIRQYQLIFYASDNTLEMYDLKTRRTFLKRCDYPSVGMAQLYKGSIITVYSRQLKIVEYVDGFTERHFAKTTQFTVAMVMQEAVGDLGKIVDSVQREGFVITEMRLLRANGQMCVALQLTGEDAVAKWQAMIAGKAGVTGSPDPSGAEAEAEAYFGAKAPKPTLAQPDQSSLLLVRSHAIMDGKLGQILDQLLGSGFAVGNLQMMQLSRPNAQEFLEVYKGVVPEYADWVEELISGKVVAVQVLMEANPVLSLRELCGAHDPEIASHLQPDSLRARFGKTKVNNAVHCTDLPEDGPLEVDYFFGILQQ